jgi:uncharacterized membrane protein YfhO
MTYDYSANSEQLALFSEVYYPPAKGWKMYLDGQPTADFIKANFLLRAAKLPAGKHQLKMVFSPNSYHTGETIAMIAALIVIGLAIWGIVWFVRQYQFPDAGSLPVTEVKAAAAAPKVRTEAKRKK